MYLLAQLKSQGLSRDALRIIFTAIVLSVVTYALQSLAGQLSIGDKARLDSLFRKAFGEDLVAKLLVLTLTRSYQLETKNYFERCRTCDTAYVHCCPNKDTVNY